MKYGDRIIKMEGVVVELRNDIVAIDLKGRLGYLEVPMRMMITDYYPEPGQKVGWKMSSIKQLGPEINDKYVSNLDVYNRRQAEARAKNEANN